MKLALGFLVVGSIAAVVAYKKLIPSGKYVPKK